MGDPRQKKFARVPGLSAVRRWTFASVLLGVALSLSCASAYRRSVGGETAKIYTRFFLTDYTTAWDSVYRALTSIPKEQQDKDLGYLRSRWHDNTTALNFADSFGTNDAYLRARVRMTIWLSKGFYNGQPAVKVSIFREQRVMIDILEGEKNVETDGIEENTFLYRVGRIIGIQMKLAKLDEAKAKKAMEPGTKP